MDDNSAGTGCAIVLGIIWRRFSGRRHFRLDRRQRSGFANHDDKGIALFGTAEAAETEELPEGGCRTSAETGISFAAMCADERVEDGDRRRPGVDGFACLPRLDGPGRGSDAAPSSGAFRRMPVQSEGQG